MRHGWIERNRILKQNEGWLYLKVPIEKSRDTPIKDVKIKNSEDWKRKMLSQLQPYKKIAPHYFAVIEMVKKVFIPDFESITLLNQHALQCVLDYLGIDTPVEIYNPNQLPIETPQEADEWALNICKAIGSVSEYWNPIGGMEFFDREKYAQANIDVKFQEVNLTTYNQKRDPFEPGLSILDVLMFNSKEEVIEMLKNFELK